MNNNNNSTNDNNYYYKHEYLYQGNTAQPLLLTVFSFGFHLKEFINKGDSVKAIKVWHLPNIFKMIQISWWR